MCGRYALFSKNKVFSKFSEKQNKCFFQLCKLTSFYEKHYKLDKQQGEQNENSKQCHVTEYIEALR